MKTVNMHEAKTHLSKLVEGAVKGEPFLIARAGKPLVKVAVIEEAAPRLLGFLEGQGTVPEDFDRLGEDEILRLFEGPDEARDDAGDEGGDGGGVPAGAVGSAPP